LGSSGNKSEETVEIIAYFISSNQIFFKRVFLPVQPLHSQLRGLSRGEIDIFKPLKQYIWHLEGKNVNRVLK
jgi:hypothetical protein